MRLNISNRIVKAGNIIEVSWDSEEGNNPRLVLETGVHQSVLSVPESGTKRFRLKGSKGKHCVKLYANVYGKEKCVSKRIFVYGKAMDTDEFEYVDRGTTSPLSRWNNYFHNWWNGFTPEKKRLYMILLSLLVIHSAGTVQGFAVFSEVGYYVLVFWLFWQVVKRN